MLLLLEEGRDKQQELASTNNEAGGGAGDRRSEVISIAWETFKRHQQARNHGGQTLSSSFKVHEEFPKEISVLQLYLCHDRLHL